MNGVPYLSRQCNANVILEPEVYARPRSKDAETRTGVICGWPWWRYLRGREPMDRWQFTRRGQRETLKTKA